MKLPKQLVTVGVAAATVGMLGAPALAASSPVNVTLTQGGPSGGRTLVLQDLSGNPLTALDMSSGTNSFVAKVVDTNYLEDGFNVQATMSNLYGYDSTTNTFTCAQKVPSSAVTLSSPTGGLDVSGLASSLVPNWVLSGDLGSVSPLLSGVTLGPANGQIQGLAESLTQTQLVGQAGQLFGSTLASLLADLPIQVSTPVGGPFTTPAADPTGAACGVNGTGATNVPVMDGVANLDGLLADLQALLTKVLGSSPTLTSLITNGYLTSSAVTSLLLNVTGLPLATLAPLLPTIESTLVGTLNSVTPLVSGLLSQSGTYAANPGLAVNTSDVPAGNYKGVLTVTLVDS